MKATKRSKSGAESARITAGDDAVNFSLIGEMMVEPALGRTIGVRAAKAHFSRLLDFVEKGSPVVITSDGKAKARLVPMSTKPRSKPWTSTREHFEKIPWRGGPDATQLVREDRDARGW